MTPPDPIRRALRWSAFSVAWTVVASAVAVTVGVSAGSLSLVAFGIIGLLDAAGSVALVWHFRHALRHEDLSHARDRVVLYLVAAGMAVIAVTTAAIAIARLAQHATTSGTAAGSVIAAVSVVVLFVLGSGKRRIGRQVGSHALVADGVVSTLGSVFAAIALTGTGADALVHWWWLDPVASIVIASGALGLAFISATRAPDALD